MNKPQSFANHRAMPPASYLAAGLILLVFAGRTLWRAAQEPTFDSALLALVALALLARLERVLGSSRKHEFARIGLKHMIALRFASDAELPELVDEVLAGKFQKADEIKRRVRDWQADWLRV
jgi:hypothetical protein